MKPIYDLICGVELKNVHVKIDSIPALQISKWRRVDVLSMIFLARTEL